MIDDWVAVSRFERNAEGRDFVIGDVHGAYDLVLMAMEQAGFDRCHDRIFSVGDLIDRGPGSYRCRRFLQQPYVFASRGNHEEMLLDLYKDGEPAKEVIDWMVRRNGLGWWLKVEQSERLAILDEIRKLPIAMELETNRGPVGFVHADIPKGMSWTTFVEEIEGGNRQVVKTALWGRDRLEHADASGVQGIGRVFVGHTPQWSGARRLGNVYAVDTGAIFAELGSADEGRLSMFNVMTSTMVLTNPKECHLVDVRDEPPAVATPFGKYAANSTCGGMR